MKKHKIYLLIIVFAASFNSCSEDVLDVENVNSLTQYSYYKTADHAHQALIACYDAIKGNGLYGLRLPWVSIALDDQGVYEKPVFEDLIHTADDANFVYIWGYVYRGIAKSNLALEKIAAINDPALDPNLKERYLGEVMFLKSLYNFIAHVHFNEPPLINEIITDMQAAFGNSTWEEFLAQIEKDLIGYTKDGVHVKGAIDILPVSYDDQNIGRATRGAALALMAKTYFYHEEWEKAKEYLQKVIDLDTYELIQAQGTDSLDYVYAFLCNSSSVDLNYQGRVYQAELNKESIFSISYGSTDFVRNQNLPGWMNDGSVLNAYNGINGWKNTSASAAYANEFEATPTHPSGIQYDPRKYGTIYVPGDTLTNNKSSLYYVPFSAKLHLLTNINTGYGIKKFMWPIHDEGAAPYNSGHDWRLIRYSDVLLMMAESEYHLNGSTDLALESINEVRSRAGLPELTEITPMDIVHERSVEFGFEGVRYWDLVRWGRIGGGWPSPTDYIPGFVVGKHEFFPIPTIEVTRMQGKLIQNPGW